MSNPHIKTDMWPHHWPFSLVPSPPWRIRQCSKTGIKAATLRLEQHWDSQGIWGTAFRILRSPPHRWLVHCVLSATTFVPISAKETKTNHTLEPEIHNGQDWLWIQVSTLLPQYPLDSCSTWMGFLKDQKSCSADPEEAIHQLLKIYLGSSYRGFSIFNDFVTNTFLHCGINPSYCRAGPATV